MMEFTPESEGEFKREIISHFRYISTHISNLRIIAILVTNDFENLIPTEYPSAVVCLIASAVCIACIQDFKKNPDMYANIILDYKYKL